ncbi:hypothetical protein ACFL2Q_06085 [Thermodesulfobacteriota bacterium]
MFAPQRNYDQWVKQVKQGIRRVPDDIGFTGKQGDIPALALELDRRGIDRCKCGGFRVAQVCKAGWAVNNGAALKQLVKEHMPDLTLAERPLALSIIRDYAEVVERANEALSWVENPGLAIQIKAISRLPAETAEMVQVVGKSEPVTHKPLPTVTHALPTDFSHQPKEEETAGPQGVSASRQDIEAGVTHGALPTKVTHDCGQRKNILRWTLCIDKRGVHKAVR